MYELFPVRIEGWYWARPHSGEGILTAVRFHSDGQMGHGVGIDHLNHCNHVRLVRDPVLKSIIDGESE